MNDLNTVNLIGRLTRDAEMRYSSGGLAICTFSIAVNRRRKQGDTWTDEPNFFNIVLMGKIGEAIKQYLIKGKQVGVVGELRQNRWEHEGKTRSTVEIMANHVQLLSAGGAQRDGGFSAEQSATPYPANENAPQQSTNDQNYENFEDDIPF